MDTDKRRKKAIKLSDELSGFIRQYPEKDLIKGTRLQRAWEKIASQQALKHTDNIVFSPKSSEPTILVFVDNSHWAAELGSQKELYRLLLVKETDYRIADIKFLVSRKNVLKKMFKKNQDLKEIEKQQEKEWRQKTKALTKEEDRYTRELVSKIKDESLQKKLYKAIKTDFEWKKGTEGLKLPQNPPESPESI